VDGPPSPEQVATVPTCESSRVVQDPAAFHGTAPYYAAGRPPYSAELGAVLRHELGLDGDGRLLDVGCGPGVLAIELADQFSEVVGVDPEPGMIAEGRRRAEARGLHDIVWMEAVAERLADLGLGPCRVVTFGQSFHRVDRYPVADTVYDLLEPDGAIVLVSHEVEGHPQPVGPDLPAIPHDEVRSLVARYLGHPVPPPVTEPAERWEETLRKTRFETPRLVVAPGRDDLVRDVDAVVANLFSMSWAAPPLFGADRGRFEDELRALLYRQTREGLFWEWPGDTEIILATKPRTGS
jgi:SAM-dependent methyltransferase